MRVAVVHSFYSSQNPSGENIVVNLQVEALRRAGHEVTLVSVTTDELEGSPLNSLRSAMRVATGRGRSPLGLIDEVAPEVVHIHNLFPNFGQKWLTDLAVPIVATMHNYRAFCSAGTLARDGRECVECPSIGSHRAIVHRCYRDSSLATVPLALATRNGGSHNPVLRRADALVCLAPRSRATYLSYYPQLAARTHVVPNFAPDLDPPSAPDPSSPWIFVGRLSAEKGILPLLKEWPHDEPLVIVGSGPLENEVKKAGRHKQVRMTGQLPPEQVRAELRSSRALIFPSTWREGAPTMTYVEALASALPVLAVGANTVTDDVLEARTGVTIPQMHSLRDAMAVIDADLGVLSKRARERYVEAFSERAWLHGIERVYASVQH